jgi:5-methylcytosine-specific restriction endonuclease McrBC regulatory subunit McrC
MVSRINDRFHLFDSVYLDLLERFFDDPIVQNPHLMPEIRSYYAPAIDLAKIIISARGIDFDRAGGTVMLPSLQIDLESLFEDYLRIVLERQLSELEPTVRVGNGKLGGEAGGRKRLFDHLESEDATPDIVIKSLSTHAGYRYVIEVKYKDREFDADDKYQAISYGMSYGTNALLVRPGLTTTTGRSYPLGTIGRLCVDGYMFHLNAADLEAEEKAFASYVHARIPRPLDSSNPPRSNETG